MKLRPKAIDHVSALVTTAVVVGLLLGYEWYSGVPITGWATATAYFGIAALNLAAYCCGGWFLYDSYRLAQSMSDPGGYPQHDDLPLMHQHFRMLVEPFVGITFAAAAVFAGVVISRTRFVDQWNWDPWVLLVFSLIAIGLLLLLYSAHDTWRDRMCDEKLRLLRHLEANPAVSGGSSAAIDAIEKIPNWAWNVRLPLQVIGALAVPLIVSVLQGNDWAIEAWRSLAKVLGFA